MSWTRNIQFRHSTCYDCNGKNTEFKLWNTKAEYKMYQKSAYESIGNYFNKLKSMNL